MNRISEIVYIQDSDSLSNRLKAVIAILLMNIIWFSNAAYSSSTFSGDRLADAAKMLVLEKFGENLDVTVPLPPSDQYFEADDIEAELIMDSKTLGRHVYLTALFYEEGTVSKKVGITAQVADKVMMPVASRHLTSGQIITPDMITFKPIDRLSLSGAAISSEKGLNGLIMLTDISSGQPFYSSNITSGKKIKRGDELELIVIKGTVQVRATATALEDGLPGESIRLERKGSKKIITATIDMEGRALLRN
jgi:flagella basal body P-ring formation protein FlgA